MESATSKPQERQSISLTVPQITTLSGNDSGASGRIGSKKGFVPAINSTASFLRADVAPQPFKHEKIYISYSPDLQFIHRRTMLECIRRLQAQGVTSLWLDREQNVLDRLEFRDYRLRAVEQCEAFLAFVDRDYVTNRLACTELRVALLRKEAQRSNSTNSNAPLIFAVFLDDATVRDLQVQIGSIDQSSFDGVCQLQSPAHAIHERAFEFMTAYGQLLDVLATFGIVKSEDESRQPPNSYTEKRITDWSIYNVQCWLQHMGIKEIYIQNFAENQVDGYLLASLSESDLSEHLLIDSASTRRKLIKTVCSILEAEAHLPVNWHLRLQRGKAEKDTVFIVCDPSNAVDAKLSDAIRTELSKAGFSTYQRADVEQDTRMIAPAISASSYILLLLTPFSAVKDVVFNDLLLADFFDKVSPSRTCVCVFKRSAFRTLPYRVQAVLSDATAIDFESEPYAKCKQFLLFWFKPTFTMNGVLMDQAFVDRMQNGLQKFAQLLRVSAELGDSPSTGTNVSDSPPFANEAVSRVSQPLFSHAHTYASMSVEEPLSRMTLTLNSKYTVYFSYSPELHSRLQKLHAVLELNNYTAYLPAAVNCLVGTTPSSDDVQSSNNLLALRNSQILVLCVTQNYIVSPPCLQDAVHAQQLGKAIVPVLFSITKWPPSNAQLREILNGNKLVDFSSDKFFVRHMPYFLERVRSALMLGSIMKQS